MFFSKEKGECIGISQMSIMTRHFLISFPDPHSEDFLGRLRDDICDPVISIKKVEQHHFTILYFDIPQELDGKLLSDLKNIMPEINSFRLYPDHLTIDRNYLVWQFRKTEVIEDMHKNLLNKLDASLQCRNDDFSIWSPHMTTGFIESPAYYQPEILALSDEMRQNINLTPIYFNKAALTRLPENGKYETLFEWSLRKIISSQGLHIFLRNGINESS